MCNFKIGNKQVVGCCCKNFMGDSESELSLFRFFKTYFNVDITVSILGMSVTEQIRYIVDFVEMITGLTDFGASPETLVKSVESKPFSYNFDEQLDAAENLYGVQIEFPADTKFLKEIEKEAVKHYTIEQFQRVEYVLRHSTRKYSYLAKHRYGAAKSQVTEAMKSF